ncbi:MAG: hypothetical protein KF765_11625 [Parvibaculaceae bacterium]|nr:hypothetical protein [Parvibaculaceae bacterium]
MFDSIELPYWIQVVQALAIPAVAIVGARIAWQQMQIASRRLDFDLYDRRFAVFVAARALIEETLSNAAVSLEALRAFNLGVSDAPFLLNDEINEYLKKMRECAAAVHSFRGQYGYQEQYHNALKWFAEQVDQQGLQKKFLPVLSFNDRRRLF